MPKSLEPVAFDWKLMHMYRGETFNASRFWRHWLSRNFEKDVVYSYLNSCIICQSRISCSWFAPAVPLSLRSVALEVFLGWICKAQARIHHWRTAYLILMMPCHDSWHLTTLRNGICCSFLTTTCKFNRFANSKTPRHLEAKAKSTKVTSSWPSNELTEAEPLNSEKRRVVTCCNGRGIRRIFDADGIRWNLGNLFKQLGKDAHEESQRSPISPAFVLWISYEIQCFTTDISTDSTKANAEQTLWLFDVRQETWSASTLRMHRELEMLQRHSAGKDGQANSSAW